MATEDDRRDGARRDEIWHKEFNEFKEYCIVQFKSLNEKVSSLTGTVEELLREIRAPPESHPHGSFRPKEEHRKTSQSRPPKSKSSYIKKDKNTSSRPTRAKRNGEEEDKTTSMAWDIFEREKVGNKWRATCVECGTVYNSPRTNVLYKHIGRCYGIDMSTRRNVRPQYTKPTNGIVTFSAEELEEETTFWASKRNTKEAEVPTESITREQNRWPDEDVENYLVRPLSEEEQKVWDTWTYREEGIITLDGYYMYTGEPQPLVVSDKYLAGLHMKVVAGVADAYYTHDTVMTAFFGILRMRSDDNPDLYLKHFSFESFAAVKILNGNGAQIIAELKRNANRLNDLKCASKVFLPVCYKKHWVLFYADTKAKRLVWLDPLADSTTDFPAECNKIPIWFKEELLPLLEFENASDWKVEFEEDIPRQKNGHDCGIFVMIYADCLMRGKLFSFTQEDILCLRKRIFSDIFQHGCRGTRAVDVRDSVADANEVTTIEKVDADPSIQLVDFQDEP